VLDLDSGSELWRAELPGAQLSNFFFGNDRVVALGEVGPSVIDLQAAALHTPAESWSTTCVIDDRVFHLAPDRRHLLMRPVENLAVESGAVVLPAEVAGLLETCGRRGGRFVVQLSLPRTGTHLLQLDSETLDATATTTIERGSFNPIVYNSRYPQSEPLSGDLLRFVPLLLDDRSDDMAHYVAMVDLDRAEIVWESPPRSELLHYRLARVGQHHYLMGQGHLAVLSGNAGELVRAIRVEPSVDIEPPQFTADGALWLASWDGVIVLDSVTFEVTGQFGEPIAVVDATDEIAELLGR
jgi:hypothetical protein